jgi:alpha-1,6-mannosyltransferase
VFGASDYVLEKLYGVGLRRLFRTPLGVDAKTFHPGCYSDELRSRLNAPRPKKLVLFLARLTTEKGIDLLMEAYPHFRDDDSVKLIIGGHGPYERHVDAFAAKYPEVVRLPFVSDRAEVARLMASADVYLSMSSDETFGLAIAEALACGTPVVAPDAGAADELLRRSGVLEPYRAHDLSSFVSCLRAVLDRGDRAFAEQLRAYALGYDWNMTFDREWVFYDQIVSAYRSGQVDDLTPPGPERWHTWSPKASATS